MIDDDEVRRWHAPDGAELAYRELGTGRPLVLLHGFVGDARQWVDVGPARALAAADRRVVLPDLRGHGRSDAGRDPSAYPPDVLVDDALALLAHLGLADGDYDLGGYSLGGRVALRMLVRGARPGRAIVAGQGLDTIERTARPRPWLSALARGEGDPATAAWVRGDPRALELVSASVVATPAADLAGIPTPTLVLLGDADDTQSRGDALAAALPAGRHVLVPGDHGGALATPEAAAAIAAFLAPGRERWTTLVHGPRAVVVELSEYDPRWPALFAAERDRIVAALGPRARLVEHIGSTSVPGLAAKPIVDVVVAVDDPDDEDAYLPPLLADGYELRVREPGHRCLRAERETLVNLHCYAPDSDEIRRYLVLRDRLRSHPEDRARYEATKRELAGREYADVNVYADAKGPTIFAILRDAGWTPPEAH